MRRTSRLHGKTLTSAAQAIRAEFERQAQLVTVLSIDIVRMAATDRVVFAERLERVSYGSKDVTLHITGVFEFDGDGLIVSSRDYFDYTEIRNQLGTP
jgi:limonene-1,2-epoxide hydrolase